MHNNDKDYINTRIPVTILTIPKPPTGHVDLALVKCSSLKVDILLHKCDQWVVQNNVHEKLKSLIAKSRFMGRLGQYEPINMWIKRNFPGSTISILKMGEEYQNDELESQIGLLMNLKKLKLKKISYRHV